MRVEINILVLFPGTRGISWLDDVECDTGLTFFLWDQVQHILFFSKHSKCYILDFL